MLLRLVLLICSAVAATGYYSNCQYTCYEHTCDELGNTCNELEDTYGCDCSGCACPTRAPVTAPRWPTPRPTQAVTAAPSSGVNQTLNYRRSKKSKKVDCGGWNHPDSEKNTRGTVYGKIGFKCGHPLYYTGFDDDTTERRDPYVCWNKHLYKSYVGWSVASATPYETLPEA